MQETDANSSSEEVLGKRFQGCLVTLLNCSTKRTATYAVHVVLLSGQSTACINWPAHVRTYVLVGPTKLSFEPLTHRCHILCSRVLYNLWKKKPMCCKAARKTSIIQTRQQAICLINPYDRRTHFDFESIFISATLKTEYSESYAATVGHLLYSHQFS